MLTEYERDCLLLNMGNPRRDLRACRTRQEVANVMRAEVDLDYLAWLKEELEPVGAWPGHRRR